MPIRSGEGMESAQSQPSGEPQGACHDTQRLSGEGVDHFYNIDDWDATYCDLGGLIESTSADCHFDGRIMHVGRLKELPPAYAVNLPVTYDINGEPGDYEVRLFETRAAAIAAYTEATTPDQPTRNASGAAEVVGEGSREHL